jgi:hypothetical protein
VAELRVAAWFQGPPGVANGDVACGSLGTPDPSVAGGAGS